MTILSAEERDALRTAMTEAWANTSTTSVAVGRLRAILSDAEQAHEPWVKHLFDEALDRGLAVALKRHRTAQRPKAQGRRGRINGVVGVSVPSATGGGEWQQLPLDDLTRGHLDEQLAIRSKQRDASTKALGALRRLLVLLEQHPNAATVGEALASEGVTLDDWLAA